MEFCGHNEKKARHIKKIYYRINNVKNYFLTYLLNTYHVSVDLARFLCYTNEE